MNQFTISCWFKTERTTDQVIFGTLNTGNVTALTVDLNTDENNVGETNNLRVFIRDDDENRLEFGLSTPYDFTDGQWHHLAIVRDSPTTGKIYLDGVEQTIIYSRQENADNFSTFEFSMTFGALNNRSTIQNYFEGSIDEIQFYNSALTRADIVSNMNKILIGNETDLVGYWNSEDRSRALDFDGLNDWVEMASDVTTGESVTISAVVRVDGQTGTAQCIAGQGVLANRDGFGIIIRDDLGVQFQVRQGGTQATVTTAAGQISLGETHVITGVREDAINETRLYIDGVEVGSVTQALSHSPATEPFSIGARMSGGSPGFYFDGMIANVQVWDKVLTPTEIAENGKAYLVGNETGLVGYWPFYRSSGATAVDDALNYDGAINGAARKVFVKDLTANNNYGEASGAEYVYDAVDFDYAMAFDGIDDHILVNGFSVDMTAFTIEFWSKRGLVTNEGRILGTFNDGTTTTGIQIWFGDSFENLNIFVRDEDNNTIFARTDSNIPEATDGEWHFWSITKTGDTVGIYIDGTTRNVNYNSRDLADNFASFQYPLAIGARNLRGTLDNYFDGHIDKVRWWSVARTAGQIQKYMNRELSGSETGLVGYWEFDNISDSLVLSLAGGTDGTQIVEQDIGLTGNAITVEAWVRPNAIATGRVLGKHLDGRANRSVRKK